VTVSARSSRPIRLPLHVESNSLVRIGFTAVGDPAATSGGASIVWLSPRLYGRQPELEPVPHVVLIVVDTLRADHVGAYGSEVSTPNIDRLAAAGVRFENAYSHIPITGPSHASVFSSMLPFEHGVENNTQIFDPGLETTAEMLGDWGRRTAGFVSLGVLRRAFGFGQGFESFYDRFPRDWMKDAGEVNAEVMKWFGGISNAPFFAWIHYSDPHEPYTPPGLQYPEVKVVFDDVEHGVVTATGRGYSVPVVVPPGVHRVRFEASDPPPRHTLRFPNIRLDDDRLELIRRDGWTTKTKRFGDPAFDTRLPAALDIVNPTAGAITTDLQLVCRELLSISEVRERYALEVEYVDRRIGELMEQLDRRGVLDNALVIFTSDHGEAFGEHNHVGHISQLYDQLIRVPLIVSYPDRVAAGMVVDDPVGLIDLYPTVAELLRLPPPAAATGRSLVPLIEGRSLPERPIVAETYRPEAYTDKRAVISAGFKYIHSVGDREWEELYDLRADPGETTDLAADRPALVEEFREVLKRRLEMSIRGTTANAELTEKEKEQLRALGYVR
jgi:arylsulfatase A-like enzyme